MTEPEIHLCHPLFHVVAPVSSFWEALAEKIEARALEAEQRWPADSELGQIAQGLAYSLRGAAAIFRSDEAEWGEDYEASASAYAQEHFDRAEARSQLFQRGCQEGALLLDGLTPALTIAAIAISQQREAPRPPAEGAW